MASKTIHTSSFHEWQINRKVKVPVLDAGGAFKDYGDLYKLKFSR